MVHTKMMNTLIALGLLSGMAAALCWFFDVYVNWQQKLFPVALLAVTAGIAALTLFVLQARGETGSGLVWKTALSAAAFTGVILAGVPAVLRGALGYSTKRATVIALSLAAVQILVLYALFLRARHGNIGWAGTAFIAAGLAASILAVGVFTRQAADNIQYLTRDGLPPYERGEGQTAIHFLSVGGDAILLESNGRFALVDAAGGSELYISEYVKQAANGHLDFVLGSHAHADHIGSFSALALDPDITIGKAFLKRFNPSFQQRYENARVPKLQALYDKTVNALARRGVPLVQDIPAEPFALGEFTITIFNGEYEHRPYDENANSMTVLAEAFGHRAFLVGDINNYGGTEKRLATQIGEVDLVKAPHHGLEGSSTKAFVSSLRPRTVVITGGGNARVLRRYNKVAGTEQIMSVGDFGGISAVLNDNEIRYYAIERTQGEAGYD